MNDRKARTSTEQQRIGTSFTLAELDEMDSWGFSRKIRSRSEVIRQLVREGLKRAETKTAAE